jgi:NifB/MoaA-like Fe-S oxidoreductase
VRAFADDFAQAAAEGADPAGTRRTGLGPAVVVTGELFAPVLRGLLEGLGPRASRVRVLPVANRFLGGNVNVAGLLTGRDIVEAVAADAADAGSRRNGPGPYLVPDLVLNDDGVTLDDVPGPELAQRAGTCVRVVSSDAAALLAELGAASAEIPAPDPRGA